MILVTHDMEEAIRLGDQIAVMDQGRLLQSASPEELLRHPREGFVSDLVGGDERALRLLGLRPVSAMMRPAECFALQENTPTIESHRTLRDALARQLWHSTPVLRVVDAKGSTLGGIGHEQLLQAAGGQG